MHIWWAMMLPSCCIYDTRSGSSINTTTTYYYFPNFVGVSDTNSEMQPSTDKNQTSKSYVGVLILYFYCIWIRICCSPCPRVDLSESDWLDPLWDSVSVREIMDLPKQDNVARLVGMLKAKGKQRLRHLVAWRLQRCFLHRTQSKRVGTYMLHAEDSPHGSKEVLSHSRNELNETMCKYAKHPHTHGLVWFVNS